MGTYRGKSATVDYTVVPKATPFEIVQSFCIAENTVVSIDSTTMKATVLVFDHFFKAAANQPTKREETPLSYRVGSKGETYASFQYSDSRYDVLFDSVNEQYYLLTVSSGTDGSYGTKRQSVTPISLDALLKPQKNVLYKSEIKENIYYSIKVDDSYNAVVTRHTLKGETTVDAVVEQYTASDAHLTVNGLFRYNRHGDGYSSTATLTPQDRFQIRKEADGVLASVYSVLCSPAA